MNNSVFDPSVDPLFDDWLVQDALGSPSPLSSPCIKQEESPVVSYSTTTPSSPNDTSTEPFILSYPSPGLSSTSSSPISSSSSTGVASPEQQIQDLFGGLANNPLTAALAALMSAAASQPLQMKQAPPTKRPTVKQQERTPASTVVEIPSGSSTPIAITPITSPSISSLTTKAVTTTTIKSTSTKRKRDASNEMSMSPQDEAAIKRQKNTDAARRSRLKKVLKMETLEKRVSDLEKINSNLILRVAVLDSEKTGLKSKESSYEERIKMLECQLAQAHKALAKRA
ncbi:hypothetical protein INT45_003920 [Circinella minor]|uniref:BZIP domain-containing protein n=1 Tax=Circinella minor TaxID=1195481 RepID=A0A8H7RWD2_9FUNG|nr:hypothetical protein INT45_003920 [Circinella minor]